jgi:hypothetical protein
MEDLKKLKVKNCKEVVKDRRTWRDLAEKAKPHKGFFNKTTNQMHKQSYIYCFVA